MMRHVFVRADGDGRIGLGHILRTMSVANELARTGVSITYLCRALSSWSAQLLKSRGHTIHLLDLPEDAKQSADAELTASFVNAERGDLILLDHYDLTEKWTNTIKSTAGCKVAAFDDLASETRNVDLLIDPSPGRQSFEYTSLLPADAICLAGSTYAPLRPEFFLAKMAGSKAQNGTNKIVISMGGADPDGNTIICLDALDGQFDANLTVIVSSATPVLDEIKKCVSEMTSPTQLLLDRSDMAAVLTDADLVIGAGGTSALERCVLGLPSVVVVLADNQINNANQLAAAGAATVLSELSKAELRAHVTPLLADAAKRLQMGKAASALCDGLGAPRAAKALLSLSSTVDLRAATADDMERVHAMQSETSARRFARISDVPTMSEHAAWFTARLTRANSDPYYIVTQEGEPCGFVRLDPSASGTAFEVSILISQTAQGQGVAHQALRLLRLTHPKRRILAEVHPDNTASQRLFESAGYERTATDQFVSEGWAEIEERHRYEN